MNKKNHILTQERFWFNHLNGNSLRINEADIYYEEYGDKDAEPLIFLHGGFGNIEDFNIILSSFSKKYRLIGIDSRGHGKSTLGTTQLSYELIQKDIECILNFLKIRTCSILGFSDGGIVGYKLASHCPERVRKLITIGAEWCSGEVKKMQEIFSKITGASWKSKFPADYQAYQRLNPDPDFDLLAKSIVTMWLNTGSSSYPNDQVKNITCQVLAMRGVNDHLVSSAKFSELQEIISNIKLFEIPNAGHAAFIDQKDICFEEIINFLEL